MMAGMVGVLLMGLAIVLALLSISWQLREITQVLRGLR